MDCDHILQAAKTFPLVLSCAVIRNGMLRLETPFHYPNGASIDVFVGTLENLFTPIIVTDFGQTTAYLLDMQIKHWQTARRRQIVADICRTLQVEQDGGQFVVRLAQHQLPELSAAIVRLAEACIRVADLSFTQRLRSPVMFRDEMEEFVDAAGVAYETGVTLPGQFGKPVPVDYRVRGRTVVSLVQTLSTANTAAAHGLANEVFRRWYDLSPHRVDNQFLTIYDSTNDVFRSDDLDRLGSLSTVFAFPAQSDAVREALAA